MTHAMTRSRASISSLAIAALLALLCAAPTAGDIGGCGSAPDEVSPDRYAAARKKLECDRCNACSVSTARCARACDLKAPPDVFLPKTCRPLTHDAEVCLRALNAASCSTFARAVDDVAPESPTECLFCREGITPPDAAVPEFVDAAAAGEGGS